MHFLEERIRAAGGAKEVVALGAAFASFIAEKATPKGRVKATDIFFTFTHDSVAVECDNPLIKERAETILNGTPPDALWAEFLQWREEM